MIYVATIYDQRSRPVLGFSSVSSYNYSDLFPLEILAKISNNLPLMLHLIYFLKYC